MDGLRKFREGHRGLAGQATGIDPDVPRILVSQLRARGMESDIMRLPTDFADVTPLQVLMSGSDFGKFFYMVGFDPIGDSNFPLGG